MTCSANKIPATAVSSCGTLIANITVLRSAGFGSAKKLSAAQAANNITQAFAGLRAEDAAVLPPGFIDHQYRGPCFRGAELRQKFQPAHIFQLAAKDHCVESPALLQLLQQAAAVLKAGAL
mgnify:CR=1 FL=1